MSITYPTQPELYQSYFDNFTTQFPLIEQRFEGALRLAGCGELPESELPESHNIGRNYLLAQWGETNPELFIIASHLYALKNQMVTNELQPIMIFRHGTSRDVLSSQNGLGDDVEMDYGLISSRNLELGFSGNLQNHGPKRMGLRPPYLGFGVSVPVYRHVRVSLDILGSFSVQPIKDSETTVPVVVGTVPMQHDVEIYQKQRNRIIREAVIGKANCNEIIDQLNENGPQGIRKALGTLALKP